LRGSLVPIVVLTIYQHLITSANIGLFIHFMIGCEIKMPNQCNI
jgi:hypothetical protein